MVEFTVGGFFLHRGADRVRRVYQCGALGRGCERNKHRANPVPCEGCAEKQREATAADKLAHAIKNKPSGLKSDAPAYVRARPLDPLDQAHARLKFSPLFTSTKQES